MRGHTPPCQPVVLTQAQVEGDVDARAEATAPDKVVFQEGSQLSACTREQHQLSDMQQRPHVLHQLCLRQRAMQRARQATVPRGLSRKRSTSSTLETRQK